MSVFPFPDITPSESTWTLVSNTGVYVSPLTGATQTINRSGERWKVSLRIPPLKGADKARMIAFLASLNGQQHRFTLRDHSYTKRGSIVATEMLDVAFNATNWESADSADGVITNTDRGVRFSVGTGETSTDIRPTTSADGISNTVSGVSYAATISTMQPRPAPDGGLAPPAQLIIRDSSGVSGSTSVSSEAKRHVAYATSPSTSLFIRPNANSNNTGDFGASIEFSGLSVSRAILVDNGFNALTRSEEFGDAAWTKTNSTVVSNPSPGANSPDGSDTADELVEDATAGVEHRVSNTYTRASVAEYWTGSIFFRANTSRRIRLYIHNGLGDAGAAYFDATSGTITGAAATGGSATNAYASMHGMGSGWYRARVSVRLPASTVAGMIVNLCDGANNTVTFNGDGTSGLYIWGAQLQRGGQLGRYIPTTTTAITGTTQSGNRIWVKGLNASTSGQLLPGDRVEINDQIVTVTSDLDGNESGVGLLECRPGIRVSTTDEAPVVLYRPHGRFMLENPEAAWRNLQAGFGEFTLECIEDIA